MKRLEQLQDALVNAGLLERKQISVHIEKGLPEYEPDDLTHPMLMHYTAAVFINDYAGDIALLSLVASLAIDEIWPSHCAHAEIVTIETDPFDSETYTVGMLVKCTEQYILRPVSDEQDTDLPILNINGTDFTFGQETLPSIDTLPVLKSAALL